MSTQSPRQMPFPIPPFPPFTSAPQGINHIAQSFHHRSLFGGDSSSSRSGQPSNSSSVGTFTSADTLPSTLPSSPEVSDDNGSEPDEYEKEQVAQDCLSTHHYGLTREPIALRTHSQVNSAKASPSPPLGIKYDLRVSARANGLPPMSWLDKDESGNYDPAEERRRYQPKKRKIEGAPQGLDADEDKEIREEGPKKPKIFSVLSARQNGVSLVVTLPFKSERGRALLEEYPDNWPEEYYDTLEENFSALVNELGDRDGVVTGHLNHNHSSYNLRERIFRPSVEGDASQAIIPDPQRIVDDLFGHPDARGCWECRRLGMRCPLLDPDCKWPCFYCIQDGCDCQLLTPPTIKQACESCKRSKLHCSYDSAGNYTQPCLQCAERNPTKPKCIAGPKLGTERIRISLDKDWIKAKLEDRPFIKCTACRQVKKRCSLKTKADPPPCKACEQDKIECTFTKVLKVNKGKQPVRDGDGGPGDDLLPDYEDEDEAGGAGTEYAALQDPQTALTHPEQIHSPHAYPSGAFLERPFKEPYGRAATPPLRLTDAAGHTGLTRTVVTSFCHPITFNVLPTDTLNATSVGEDSLECHFCSHAAFALWGFGSKEVVVIDWDDGMGYTEVVGGFAGEGVPHTRMCVTCTLSRINVVGCECHVMVPLSPHETEGQEQMDGLEKDMEKMAAFCRIADNECLPSDRWCGICRSLATYKCAAEQETYIWGENVSLGALHGCGLFLCSDCNIALANRGGDLQNLLTEMPTNMAREYEERKQKERDGDRVLTESQESGCEDDGMKMGGLRADVEFLKWDGMLMKNVMGNFDG